MQWDPGRGPEDLAALIDGGANLSAISACEAQRLGLRVHRAHKTIIKLGKGRARTLGTTTMTGAQLNGHACKHIRLHVIDGLNQPLVIGMDTLKRERVIIDCELGELWFKDDMSPLALLSVRDKDAHGSEPTTKLLECDTSEFVDDDDYTFFSLDLRTILRAGFEEFSTALDQVAEEDDSPAPATVSPSAKGSPVDERIAAAIKRFPRVFTKPTGIPPRRGDYDFEIKLKDGAEPVRKKHYRLSLEEKKAVWDEVQRLLKLGWIETSRSAWSCPILFAKNRKKDGRLRAVYDYRSLNAVTQLYQGPIPRIDDIMNRLEGASVFTLMDATGAFNQVRIKAGHEEYSAFSTPFALYHSLVMMMGMANASSHMQALMEAVIRGDPAALPHLDASDPRYHDVEAARTDALEDLSSFVLVYIDDILVFSKTKEEHYEHVEKIIQRLDLFDIRINEFSEFAQDKVDVLGFEVSKNTLRVTEKRAASIREWPTPTNASELHTFLGLVNFYRENVPQFALHAAQLTPLINKKVTWNWTAREQAAFDEIRNGIAQQIERYTPTSDRPYVLAVDASIYAVGGVLMQEDTNGDLRTVSFFSRQTRGAEPRYSQYHLEFLGLVASLQHFRTYLDGCQALTIYTDHKPLVTGKIFDVAQPHHHNHRVARWVEKIAPIRADLRHHSATASLAKIADAFSRRPDYVQATQKDMAAWLADIRSTHAQGEGRNEPEYLITHIDDETIETAHQTDFLERIRAGMSSDDAEVRQYVEAGYTLDESERLWRHHGRVVVPKDERLRADIIQTTHEAHGHAGRKATTSLIRRTFWWPRIWADVAEALKKCVTCAKAKPRTWKRKGPSFPLPIASDCWTDIEIDFLPKLPASGEHKFTRLAVIYDRRSGEVKLVPCHDTMNAETFADLFINHVWRARGAPRILRTDHDRLFISKAWKAFCTRLRVDPRMTAPFEHQQLGGVERANQHVEQLLRAYVQQYPEQWSEFVAVVEHVYNATPRDRLGGLSPFETVYGWKPRMGLVLDDLAEIRTDDNAAKTRLEIAAWVTEKLLDAQDLNFRADDRSFDPQVGDRVFLSSENIAAANLDVTGQTDGRLRPRWLGPFVVLARSDNTRAVDIELPTRWKVENPIAISRLKPCYDTTLPPVELVWNEETQANEVMAEVDFIVSHTTRGRGAKKFVKACGVRFVGYTDDMDRLYEGDDFKELLRTAPKSIQEYLRQHKLRLAPEDTKVLKAALKAQA